jgi:hypothetical protein
LADSCIQAVVTPRLRAFKEMPFMLVQVLRANRDLWKKGF